MYLDCDCIRDVLLCLEEKLLLDENLNYIEITLNELVNDKTLSKHNKQNIAYTVYLLADAEYIIAGELHKSIRQQYYSIKSLTYKGHKFLDNIRNDKTFEKSKKICKTLGNIGLSALSAVSEGIASAAIKSYFETSL